MTDFILIDGDRAFFFPIFGKAFVIPQSGVIRASGEATLGSKKVCIKGDEQSVAVKGCTYLRVDYPIVGKGTLLIDKLATEQVARHTNSANKSVLLKGKRFKAKFKVTTAAKRPTSGGPVPDTTQEYGEGIGVFLTANTKFKGI